VLALVQNVYPQKSRGNKAEGVRSTSKSRGIHPLIYAYERASLTCRLVLQTDGYQCSASGDIHQQSWTWLSVSLCVGEIYGWS